MTDVIESEVLDMVEDVTKRILVVDDEPKYILALRANLEARGYEVLSAVDGPSAINLAAEEHPDLVLLDVRMPGLSGYETCRRIRAFASMPILMLTAMAESADKVKGLDCGADDYITKPFAVDELLARVRATLRRNEMLIHKESNRWYKTEDFQVDFAGQRVYYHGDEVELTPTEFHLLVELIHHAGRVLMPDYLLGKVWGDGYEGETRLLWQAIHRLRHKIEPNPKRPQYIITRSGLGYLFSGR